MIPSTVTQRDIRKPSRTKPAKIMEAIAPEATRLRQEGLSWGAIGLALGVTGDTAHRAVDPEYSERRKALNNEARRSRRHAESSRLLVGIHRVETDADVARDAARLIAQIPPDTRDLTARLLGDPLPGRSALDHWTRGR